MRGGQASTELIVVIAMALIVIIAFLIFSSSSLLGLGNQQNYGQARSSVQALAEAADTVYAQGSGASTVIAIIIPSNTNFNANYTYIGRPLSFSNATANGININVNGTDEYATSRAPLTGSFPAAAGTYQMKVVSHGSYVSIGSHLIEASPSSAYLAVAQNGRKTLAITFTVVPGDSQTNNTVRTNIAIPWNYSGVTVNASPSYFSAYEYTGVPVTVSVSASQGAAGTYNSAIYVNATGSASSESFSIPVSVEVD